jgi:hypothetical protein
LTLSGDKISLASICIHQPQRSITRHAKKFGTLIIEQSQNRRPDPGFDFVQRWTCATGICQRICKAYVVDETFGVNSAFNAEVFVAPPHAVAMEFDLFGERRSSHWVKGGGISKREHLVG